MQPNRNQQSLQTFCREEVQIEFHVLVELEDRQLQRGVGDSLNGSLLYWHDVELDSFIEISLQGDSMFFGLRLV